MLQAIPNNPFSWDYGIWDAGSCLAGLGFAWFREQGWLQVAGTEFQLRRRGWWSVTFTLERPGLLLAQAQKPNALFRRFELEYEGRCWVLQALSPVTRSFALYAGESPIGSIQPEHCFTRKATIDLPDDLPLPVQLFAFWLVVLTWRRQARRTAS